MKTSLVLHTVVLLTSGLVPTLNAWSSSVANPRRRSLSLPSQRSSRHHRFRLSATAAPSDVVDEEEEVDLEFLKRELTEYMEKRKQVGADEKAKEDVGKVVGGTKGNVILDFVSGAPNKEFVVETPSNPFDYDELTKYGYGNLVTPIMKAGGRLAMYDLLGLEQPPVTSKPKPKSAPKLVIDRTGENDSARYSGLKLGQVLDDNMQAEALANVERKRQIGEELRPKLQEELFERPFADRRNVGPRQTPDWTPEQLDEWGKKQGQAIAWARKAEQGEFVSDPMESLDLEPAQRFYSILTALCVAFAFGRSTPTLLTWLGMAGDNTLGTLLATPAAALFLAAVGSSVFCAVQASGKNRNAVIWFVKGLLGGPLTIRQLVGLSQLITVGEQMSAEQQQNSSTK